MKNIFSIDVEDWFHILDLKAAPNLAEWDRLPSRVEKNFLRLLELLSSQNIRATCFFLGWVAEKFPHLLKEADKMGHEVASHGYSHRLVYTMTKEEFRQDLLRAKGGIESIVGKEVLGYRAPGFSFTEATPWAVEGLTETGFRYDSSIFPATRNHGGMAGSRLAPYVIQTRHGDLWEFPITVAELLRKRLCFFGGGYFRLFPYVVIQSMMRKVNRENRPVIVYIHPREIDPNQPRLPMGRMRSFKCYINLKSTERKIEKAIGAFEFTSFREWLELSGIDVSPE